MKKEKRKEQCLPVITDDASPFPVESTGFKKGLPTLRSIVKAVNRVFIPLRGVDTVDTYTSVRTSGGNDI